MISILAPTRKRPKELRRMVESVRATAAKPDNIQIVVYIDSDDPTQVDAARVLDIDYIQGPRPRYITNAWNQLVPIAKGDIFMQGNDDIVFQTKGWDETVEKEFEKFPDRIVMVHGSDEGQHFENFAAHPFVHRRWFDTLGYFTPPYFSSDYGDTWINALANMVNRRRYVPIKIEHMHFLFKKAQIDDTTRERLARHEHDHPERVWSAKVRERWEDAVKLGRAMNPPFRPPEPGRAQNRYMNPVPGHLNFGGNR